MNQELFCLEHLPIASRPASQNEYSFSLGHQVELLLGHFVLVRPTSELLKDRRLTPPSGREL